ncbi:MAG: carboxypeptidase-like regulatory domain-containing protein, partial [Acidobacteriaceae bacterium]
MGQAAGKGQAGRGLQGREDQRGWRTALRRAVLRRVAGFAWLAGWLAAAPLLAQSPVFSGVVRTTAGQPAGGATVEVFAADASGARHTGVSRADGRFTVAGVMPGPHRVAVQIPGRVATAAIALRVTGASVVLTVSEENQLSVEGEPLPPGAQASAASASSAGSDAETTGGEKLSSQAVSSLPLNGRDFSTLLLLAAGTMTDVNGATNFTQQFAINGQRGVEAVFAMDGADISDPEMGGSTFTNFNVDAIQELQSSSGWMPADIGRGAAGFTNIVTRSGKSGFHGSFFEFLRNSALDARNYFDHPSIAEPGRIPPFRRNEFGFTNGGPVVLPHLYDGRGRTFYFGQYQGFRQVLGTTQVLAVPTAAERAGEDAVTYPDGSRDTLHVPVNPQIAAVLARYPLPNNPTGAYGDRTYAAPSNVATDADQFSIRIDQKLGAKGQFLGRFNYDNLTGPTTNPDQTLLDPTFGVQYVDRQRNVVFTYTRTVSPRLLWSASLSITRTTPSFPTPNRTDPALKFTDGLFEPFDSA